MNIHPVSYWGNRQCKKILFRIFIPEIQYVIEPMVTVPRVISIKFTYLANGN